MYHAEPYEPDPAQCRYCSARRPATDRAAMTQLVGLKVQCFQLEQDAAAILSTSRSALPSCSAGHRLAHGSLWLIGEGSRASLSSVPLLWSRMAMWSSRPSSWARERSRRENRSLWWKLCG